MTAPQLSPAQDAGDLCGIVSPLNAFVPGLPLQFDGRELAALCQSVDRPERHVEPPCGFAGCDEFSVFHVSNPLQREYSTTVHLMTCNYRAHLLNC